MSKQRKANNNMSSLEFLNAVKERSDKALPYMSRLHQNWLEVLETHCNNASDVDVLNALLDGVTTILDVASELNVSLDIRASYIKYDLYDGIGAMDVSQLVACLHNITSMWWCDVCDPLADDNLAPIMNSMLVIIQVWARRHGFGIDISYLIEDWGDDDD